MLFPSTLSKKSTQKQTSNIWNYYKHVDIIIDGEQYIVTFTTKILIELEEGMIYRGYKYWQCRQSTTIFKKEERTWGSTSNIFSGLQWS